VIRSRLVVIDASVALKWVLAEPGRAQAMELLDAYGHGTMDLIAPRLIMEEVASALSKRCRRKELSHAQAEKAFELFDRRRPCLADTTVHLRQAFSLSLRHHLSLWDCIYLALAIDRRADLITADRRFHRSVSQFYPFTSMIGISAE
jgi:predicted nucleic acid-binding protein